MTLPAGEISEMLPPEAASVSRARRLVGAAMTAGGHDELVDVASLLVSEVVTNSLLHAGTEIHLSCHPSGIGVRVEVFDGSPLLPTVRHYDPEATTGRGLALVSALAASWGVDREDGGKTLWFELGNGEDGDQVSPSHAVTGPADRQEATIEVHLRGASPLLIGATIEHGDALLREVALLSLGGEVDDALPEGWHLPQFDVSPILAAVEAALARGEVTSNLKLTLPAEDHTTALERLRLVDHAEALAREGRLLLGPALPELAMCRHWLYTQIVEQAAGFPPQAWELPDGLEPSQAAAGLSTEDVERFDGATSATVVADDANRIILVNEAAGELLGWEPDALVGRRLTVLIPPDLRQAHLAGFSRLQVTGQPRILGSTVHVPALRRDGVTVEVALTINRLAGRGGRSAFHAVLEPIIDA